MLLYMCPQYRWGKNVCSKNFLFSDSITSDEGGIWWVVSANKGQVFSFLFLFNFFSFSDAAFIYLVGRLRQQRLGL